MYAGPVSAISGVYGYNYIYGTGGNIITAGLPPGAIPAFAGTNYIYGTNGTSINNGLYTDNIYSYGTSNLNITAQSSRWVDIQRAQRLSMDNNPLIDFVSGNGRLTGVSSINGAVYPIVGTTLTIATILGSGPSGLLQIGDNTNTTVQINSPYTIRNTAPAPDGQVHHRCV
jgi:hypothetical protein